ncbi:hypothetical protein [Mycobacterium sp. SMC-14]|uniref:hypothetical protein n=1 Tax=Mycobacterium sp. SMC-14 TaxID=3385968 RepID=UPI00390CBB4C
MTMPTPTVHDSPLPVAFDVPPINPAPGGLFAAVDWQPSDGPSRFLTGVELRGMNFPGDQVGVWDVPWCGVPVLDGPRKEGTRGDVLDPFEPVTVWAFDACDLTAPSRAEVEQRAAQALRMRESVVVARQFATRLLADAAVLSGVIPTATDVVAALSTIEGEFSESNALGYVHASPDWLPVLVSAQLLTRSGARWTTPGGHALVLDGGYRAGLGATMIATSAPLLGWRDGVVTRTSLDERQNLYVAIAERSVLVSYEAVVAAVEIAP